MYCGVTRCSVPLLAMKARVVSKTSLHWYWQLYLFTLPLYRDVSWDVLLLSTTLSGKLLYLASLSIHCNCLYNFTLLILSRHLLFFYCAGASGRTQGNTQTLCCEGIAKGEYSEAQ